MSNQQRCPICGISWAAPVACCPCGFAPSAMDEFLVRLRMQRRRAIVQQLRGVSLVAAVPLWLWLLTVTSTWFFATPLVGVLCVAGAIQLARGTQALSQSTLRLRAAREIRQLPAARVVVKP